MKITLIGMSNVGKTYWSKKLEQIGFIRYSCDEMIQNKLEKELRNIGFRGIEDLAGWMGQPYDKHYNERSSRYLKFENESLREIIAILEKWNYEEKDIVIDTTGSVIHANSDIMAKLKELTTVICLDVTDEQVNEMFNRYMNNPRPVIWDGHFKRKSGESEIESLKKCYPRLLSCRYERYKKHSRISLDYQLLRQEDFFIDDFIYEVALRLKEVERGLTW